MRCSAGEDVRPKTEENKLEALLSDFTLGSGEVLSAGSGGVAGGAIEVRVDLHGNSRQTRSEGDRARLT